MSCFPRRPGERRDPYAVSYRMGDRVETFCNNEHQGLWVPAPMRNCALGRDDQEIVYRSCLD
jgi:hypothetical protein